MKQRLREADILKKQINGLMDGWRDNALHNPDTI